MSVTLPGNPLPVSRYWRSDGQPLPPLTESAIRGKCMQLGLQILEFDQRGLRVATSSDRHQQAADQLERWLKSIGEITR